MRTSDRGARQGLVRRPEVGGPSKPEEDEEDAVKALGRGRGRAMTVRPLRASKTEESTSSAPVPTVEEEAEDEPMDAATRLQIEKQKRADELRAQEVLMKCSTGLFVRRAFRSRPRDRPSTGSGWRPQNYGNVRLQRCHSTRLSLSAPQRAEHELQTAGTNKWQHSIAAMPFDACFTLVPAAGRALAWNGGHKQVVAVDCSAAVRRVACSRPRSGPSTSSKRQEPTNGSARLQRCRSTRALLSVPQQAEHGNGGHEQMAAFNCSDAVRRAARSRPRHGSSTS